MNLFKSVDLNYLIAYFQLTYRKKKLGMSNEEVQGASAATPAATTSRSEEILSGFQV